MKFEVQLEMPVQSDATERRIQVIAMQNVSFVEQAGRLLSRF